MCALEHSLVFQVQDRNTGRFIKGSRVAAWPFHVILNLRLALRRAKSKEPLIQEVGNGWYIGGWPPTEAALPKGDLSVVDCTSEYPRTFERPYICLPTWDTQGYFRLLRRHRSAECLLVLHVQAFCPGGAYVTLTAEVHTGVAASDVKRGVEFALQQRRLGRAVLVHCAHGHGRSAQVLIASMVMAGDAASIDAALSTLQAARPKCKLNRLQRSNLEEYLSSVDPPKH